MHIDYSDVTVSHVIENNLHKQQCVIGLTMYSKLLLLGRNIMRKACRSHNTKAYNQLINWVQSKINYKYLIRIIII